MDPIRPPDITQNDCLLEEPFPSRSRTTTTRTTRTSRSRRRRGDGENNTMEAPTPPTPTTYHHLITWDQEEQDIFEEEEAQLCAAMEESLREQQERDKNLQEQKKREESLREEQEQQEKWMRESEARRQKFGLVVARLRLMRHPTDPVVDEWLERIEEFCVGNAPSTPLSTESEHRLSVWLEKRRRNSPFLDILGQLLKK